MADRFTTPPVTPLRSQRGMTVVKPKDMKGTLLRLWRLTKGHRQGLLTVFLLSGLAAGTAMVSPYLIGRIVDRVELGQPMLLLLLALLLVYLGDAGVRLAQGWLMAGEIAHYAHQGVRSFIILQPFGCLPNHVCGRGVTKRLKEEFPGVQILPLDLDPDTSYANVENRLQMLIMNQTAEAEHSAASVEPAPQKTRGGSPRPALSST